MTTPNEVELFRVRLSRGFYEWNVREVMRTVIENPKLLTNCGKTLALQRACDMDRTIVSVELIRLLIEEGSRQNFGERGGLRTSRNHGSAPLQVLAKRGSLQVLKFLSEAQPPLLCKEDVSTFNLLHVAAGHGHVDVVRFLMTLDPDAASSRDQDGALPIHMTCSFRKDFTKLHMIREILLRDYIHRNHLGHQDSNNNTNSTTNSARTCTITHTTGEENHDQDAINILEWFFPRVHTSKDVIAKYVEDVAQIMNGHNVSIPLLCAAIRVGVPHSHLKCIIDLVNDSAQVREHKTNRLPIHLAVERGMKWYEGLKDIVEAYPVAVDEVDKKTCLNPFALAAADDDAASESPTSETTHCNLDSIYELMQQNPSM